MQPWDELRRELDAWAAAGRPATLWWRDDDAVEMTDGLRRLLDVGATAAGRPVPLCLAVIPEPARESLADAALSHIVMLQHGFAHKNWAGPGTKKAEYPVGRPAADMLAELAAGRRLLDERLGRHVLPTLVPPWNRIDPGLIARLPEAGLGGLSTHGPRSQAAPAVGVRQVNSHADVIDWHGGRGFIGTAAAIGLLVRHLVARRIGQADAAEPTGLLTHHLVHDAPTWSFIAELLRRTAGHDAVRWLAGREMFDHVQPMTARPAMRQ